jgi:Flp pilus assembly protein TadD
MKNICKIRLISAVLFAEVVFIGLLFLQGCTNSARPESMDTLATQKDDADFASGANRPPTAKTLFAMADIMVMQEKDEEARLMLRRLIKEYPLFMPAYNSLAELEMRQHRIKEAIQTISSGLLVNHRDPVLLNNLGMCRIVSHDYKEALEMFTQAAGVMPENTRYRANMAMTLGLMGRYEESLFLFEQILPEEQVKNNLNVLRKTGRYTNFE